MKNPLILLLAFLMTGSTFVFAKFTADETIVTGRVESVAMFKNGLVVVKETIPISGPGQYLLERVPQAILGTFFLESDFPVETTVTTRTVEGTLAEITSVEYWKQLQGKIVSIRTNDDNVFFQGQLLHVGVDLPKNDSVNTLLGAADTLPRNYYPGTLPIAGMPRQFVIVRRNNMEETVFVDLSQVTSIKTSENIAAKKTVPVMIFDIGKKDSASSAGTISLFYLTKGMTWSPSYRIDLADSKTLTIEQNAVIANELMSLEDTEMALISGFPRIEFEQTLSLMSPNTTLLTFFNQLANVGRGGVRGSSPVMTQQAIMSNMAMPSMPEVNTLQSNPNEGPDTYYHSIGRKNLERDARRSLSVAKDSAEYERFMECKIPVFANPEQPRNNQQEAPYKTGEISEVWEVVHFNNPFDFPMTTAPATVTAGGRFLGQNSSFWTAPGAELTVPITRAMSVQVISDEEERGGRIDPWVAVQPDGRIVANTESGVTLYRFGRNNGTNYRKQTIDATLTVKNQRSEGMKIVVTRQLLGEYLDSQGSPEVKILVERVSQIVNRTHELKWQLTLEPGETRKIAYSYERYIPY